MATLSICDALRSNKKPCLLVVASHFMTKLVQEDAAKSIVSDGGAAGLSIDCSDLMLSVNAARCVGQLGF